MISDLLDFTQARLGSGLPVHRARVDLHQVTDTLVDELRVSAPDQQIVVKHSGDAAGASGGERIAQVVGNLIGNAVKFSPENEVLTLEVRGEAGAGLREQTRFQVRVGNKPCVRRTLVAGPLYSLALYDDGTVWAWGNVLHPARQRVPPHARASAAAPGFRLPRAAHGLGGAGAP